jgi:hypothetical protein
MRRAIRCFAVLAAVLGATAGLGGAGAACHREAAPVAQPEEPPPPPPPALPPASGSPIGFLVDESSLQLSDDQLVKLKEIDADLAKRLGYLDAVLRSAETAKPENSGESRGGLSFGGAQSKGTPGEQAVGSPGAIGNTADGSRGGGGRQDAEQIADIKRRVPTLRAQDVRAAIAHALDLFDARQKQIARQVLKDRGVDPDSGTFDAAGEPGASPGSGSGSGSN